MPSIPLTRNTHYAYHAYMRKHYVVPDPEVPQSFDTDFGRIEIDNRVPPGEIRLHNWNGPTLLKHIKAQPEEQKEGNK